LQDVREEFERALEKWKGTGRDGQGQEVIRKS